MRACELTPAALTRSRHRKFRLCKAAALVGGGNCPYIRLWRSANMRPLRSAAAIARRSDTVRSATFAGCRGHNLPGQPDGCYTGTIKSPRGHGPTEGWGEKGDGSEKRKAERCKRAERRKQKIQGLNARPKEAKREREPILGRLNWDVSPTAYFMQVRKKSVLSATPRYRWETGGAERRKTPDASRESKC